MLNLYDPLMIITDLDGTLLDHHTYSWQPAEPWLARLRERKIPLIFCSSKTAAEIIPLQQALGFAGAPFISENGAFVYYDDAATERVKPFAGKDYTTLCHILMRLRQRDGFKFTGFADVSENDVAEWTGLTPAEAARAKMREASESVIWRDTPEQFTLFLQRLEDEQLELVQGGRFWNVMSKGSNKGQALRWLLERRAEVDSLPERRPVTIGLGDGPNDAPMLECVDYAVVVKGYSKNEFSLHRSDSHNVYRTTALGPQGWCEGLDHFITPS